MIASRYYLNQCWLIFSDLMWHSPMEKRSVQGIYSVDIWWYENYEFEMTTTSFYVSISWSQHESWTNVKWKIIPVLYSSGIIGRCRPLLTLHMLNLFKDYKKIIHILNSILDLAWWKYMELILKQHMLSARHSQYQYHACWCSGRHMIPSINCPCCKKTAHLLTNI